MPKSLTPHSSRRSSFSWFALIGVSFFIYLIFKNDPRSIIRVLSSLKFSVLFFALPLFFVHLFVWVFKFFYLIRLHTDKITFSQATAIVFKSSFFSLIAPGQLGRLTRIKFLRDVGSLSLKKATYLTIFENIIELTSLLLIAILGYFFSLRSFLYLRWSSHLTLLIIVLTIFSISLLIFRKKLLSLWRTYCLYLFSTSLKPARIIILFLLCLLFWLLAYFFNYYLARALGINLNPFYLISVFSFTMLGKS